MVQSDPAPLQQPVPRRRRSDRYLEQEQAPAAQPASSFRTQPADAQTSQWPQQAPRMPRSPRSQRLEAQQAASAQQPRRMPQPAAQQQTVPEKAAQPQAAPHSPRQLQPSVSSTAHPRQPMPAQPVPQAQQQPNMSNTAHSRQPMPAQPVPQAQQQPGMSNTAHPRQPMPAQPVPQAQQQPGMSNTAHPRQPMPTQPMGNTLYPQPMPGSRQSPYPAGHTVHPGQSMGNTVPPRQQAAYAQQSMPPAQYHTQPPTQMRQPSGYGWEGAAAPGYYGQQQGQAWQQTGYGQQVYATGAVGHGSMSDTFTDPSQSIPTVGESSLQGYDNGRGGGWMPPWFPWKTMVAVVVLVALLVGVVTGGRAVMEQNRIRNYVAGYNDRFCEGVYVDGIHLGGMTQQEGVEAVTEQAQRRNNEWYVRLTYQGSTVVELNAAQLGMRVDVFDALRLAWQQGHGSNDMYERQAAMEQLIADPYYGETVLPSGDTSVVDTVLEDLRSRVYRAPQDAAILDFNPDLTYPFTFQEEVVGVSLNIESLKEQIYRMVSTMESGELELKLDTLMPSVTLAQLQQSVALRADEYTLISTTSTENRTNNIKRAFELISGTVLRPGDVFSFNGVVGKRTVERGFFSAVEYQYNKEVEGIGGGVCQASTTMYLAAVAANLQITKHTPHSMEVGYTTFGKDATVNMDGKQIDFCFMNNTEGNIYIVASVQSDRSIDKNHKIARVRIYGPYLGDGVSYKLQAEEIEFLPRETEIRKDTKGEYDVTYTDEQVVTAEGRDGHVTQSYRVKYQNGVEVERVPLYTDTYKASPTVIYVGTQERWDY